jgi:hypothetical protein
MSLPSPAYSENPDTMPLPFRPLGLALPALLLTITPVFADPGRPLGELLSGYAVDGYGAALSELSARLDLSGGAGAVGRPGPIMDLAELHLAHGFWAEAGSLLDAISPETLSATDRSRWDRLRAVSALFTPTGTKPDPAPLIRDRTWPDAALLRSVAGIWGGSDLSDAAGLIRSWPEPARDRAVPILLERAITAEDWSVVRDLSGQVRASPALAGTPADLFLQGVAAERAGLPEAALTNYLEAGRGGDVWAARARLAWAELALASGLAPKREVRDHLASARTRWRGGEIGLKTLTLLFGVTRDLGEALDGLDLIAEIRDRHRDEADLVIPDEEAWALMELFYAQGAQGDIPFGPFFEGHLRLFRSLATEPRYLDLVEGLAEQLAGRGAHLLAGEEYRRVLDTLRAQASSAHSGVPAERLDRVRLRLAEALLDAGRSGEATEMLAEPVREVAFIKRQESLRARAFQETGDWSAVLSTWVADPEPDHLGRIAQAHHALAEWDASRRTHIDLLNKDPEPDGAVLDRLILASFRAGMIREDEGLIRPLTDGTASRLLDALLSSDLPATAMRRADIEARLAEVSGLIGEVEPQIGSGEEG